MIVRGTLYVLKRSKCECFLTGFYWENHWVGSNCKIPNTKWHLRRDLSKEKETDFNKGICHLNHGKQLPDLNTQLQVLEVTKGKSKAIVANGNLEGVERHLNTLRSATKRVDECKVQVEQAKIANGESFEEVAEWSLGVENKQTAADVNIEYLKNCLAEEKQRDNLLAKETEEAILQESRKKQLEFEQTQLEMNLANDKEIEEAKMSQSKTTEHSPHQMKTTKLPTVVISKFRGELTDWPRFGSQIEDEVDRADVPGVTKYSYLKDLVDPKIRKEVDGLPFSSEG